MTAAMQCQEDGGLKVRRRMTLGTVTVEMAMVAPVLVMLLFGIIEFGFIFKDVLMLKQTAREGVRIAVTGACTTEIIDRIENSSPTLITENLGIELQYRTYSSGWSEWYTLGDIDSGGFIENDATRGAQVRVMVTYPHQLVTGGLFSNLADDPDSQTVTLAASGVMRRE